MTENITMILLFLLTGCFRTSLFSSEEAGGIVTSLSLSELFAADSLSLGVVLLQPELLQDLQAQQGPLC